MNDQEDWSLEMSTVIWLISTQLGYVPLPFEGFTDSLMIQPADFIIWNDSTLPMFYFRYILCQVKKIW